MQKQRRRSAYREADQRLCFRYIDSKISLLPKYEISSLYPSCVALEPGLCRTWSETPNTGFLASWLILYKLNKQPILFFILIYIQEVLKFCRTFFFFSGSITYPKLNEKLFKKLLRFEIIDYDEQGN